MVATLFYAPASTANTIANGPNFSHGPLQPLFLLRSFSTDERQTGLASHPKYTIASICLTFVLEAEDWLNHMKIKAYFSQVVEPLNRKIYCPPARARPHCRDGGTFFPPSSWVPVSRPTATGSLGRVKKAPMHSFHLSQGCHMLQDIRRNGN